MPFCCVPMCSERSGRPKKDYQGPKITFHTLPKEPDMLEQFALRIRREIGPNFKVNMHTRICSKHYRTDDFYCYDVPSGRRQLKPGVLPSIFDFTPKPKETKPPKSVNRTCARKVLAGDEGERQILSPSSCDSFLDAAEQCSPRDGTPLSPIDVKPELDELWSETEETGGNDMKFSTSVEELRERLEEQRSEILSLVRELDAERRARRSLETEVSKLKSSIGEMRDKLVAAESEIHELQRCRRRRTPHRGIEDDTPDCRVCFSAGTNRHQPDSNAPLPKIRIKTEF